MGDAEDGHGVGGRRWPYYAIGLIVAVGATVAGVLIAATHPSSHEHRHGPAFVIVFAVVAAVVVGALVVWRLRRQLNQPAMRKIREFSFSQRRATIRAANSGNDLTAEQRSIAQAQLDLLGSASARLRWALPLAMIAFVALAVANADGRRWFWAAIAAFELLCVTAAVLLFRRQTRRLEKALARSSG